MASLSLQAPIPVGPPAWLSSLATSISSQSSNGGYDRSAPPRPPLPVFNEPLPFPVNASSNSSSSRFAPSSADLDFLMESIGATALKASYRPGTITTPAINFNPEVSCRNCKRQLPPEKMIIIQNDARPPICRDCQSAQATHEDAGPRRKARWQLFGGLGAGLAASASCLIMATQFGLSADMHQLNWLPAAIVGAIIGLAVRLGALNRSGYAHQGLAVVLTLGTLAGAVYLCLNAMTATTLSLSGAIEVYQGLSHNWSGYALGGLGLLLAFVIPSGLFGGETDSAAVFGK